MKFGTKSISRKKTKKSAIGTFKYSFFNDGENKSSQLDITNTTIHRIKSRVISAINDNRELLEVCANSGNLITLIESSDDQILDTGYNNSNENKRHTYLSE